MGSLPLESTLFLHIEAKGEEEQEEQQNRRKRIIHGKIISRLPFFAFFNTNMSPFKFAFILAMVVVAIEGSPREKRGADFCCPMRCAPHQVCSRDRNNNPVCKIWFGYCDAYGRGAFNEISQQPGITSCSWWTGRAARRGWNCFTGHGTTTSRHGCRFTIWGCGNLLNKYCSHVTRDVWFQNKPDEFPYCAGV